MGSISFQVVGDGTVGTRAKTFTISDANINRLVVWAKANFPNDDGTEPTTPQALLQWAELMMDETKRNVVNYERSVSSLPPFEAT